MKYQILQKILKTRIPAKTEIVLVLGVLLLIAGCTRRVTLSANETAVIWQLYYSREFIESLEEKLSSEQRKQILQDIAERNSLDYTQMMSQLRDNDPKRFENLFY